MARAANRSNDHETSESSTIDASRNRMPSQQSLRDGSWLYIAKLDLRTFVDQIAHSGERIFEGLAKKLDRANLTQDEIVCGIIDAVRATASESEIVVGLNLLCDVPEKLQQNHFGIHLSHDVQEKVIDFAIKTLRHKDPQVSRQAVNTLATFAGTPGKEVVAALAEHGVTSADAMTALSSIDLLEKAQVDLRSIAVPRLIQAFANDDDAVSIAVCKILGTMGPDSRTAAPELTRLAVSERTDDVRFAAITSLLKIQNVKVAAKGIRDIEMNIPALLDFLRACGPDVRKLRRHLAEPISKNRSKPRKGQSGRKPKTKRNIRWAKKFCDAARKEPQIKLSEIAGEIATNQKTNMERNSIEKAIKNGLQVCRQLAAEFLKSKGHKTKANFVKAKIAELNGGVDSIDVEHAIEVGDWCSEKMKELNFD